jgi:NAD(P)H-dependent flavin oxidoreductase YrpB (nitropropane dioxygenase family)
MRTEVCETFGIEFPLFAFSHCRDVVAAVTNAGGLGVLGAVAYTPDRLEEELRWIDDHVGGRPYGVDVLVPGKLADVAAAAGRDGSAGAAKLFAAVPREHWDFLTHLFGKYGVPVPDLTRAAGAPGGAGRQVTAEGATELIDVALAHPIRLIASALGPPPPIMVERARAAEIPVAALVGTVEHARRQVAAGVDLIVAQGGEAGGHTGEISTMVLVPEVVDAVAPAPVLGAGGIGSGRQIAAALALGAQGVWLGSLWLTTQESNSGPAVLQAYLEATSADTVRSRCYTGKPARMLRNQWTDAWADPEGPGPLGMPLQNILTSEANARIARSGRKDLAFAPVGQIVGRMNEVRSVRDVMYDLVEEYIETVERLEQGTQA